MSTSRARGVLTIEAFARTSDPPGHRTELHRGQIVTLPMKTTVRCMRAAVIGHSLGDFAMRHNAGYATGGGGYILARDPDTVRAPDAAFIETSRIPPGGFPQDDWIEGAPTLAVEVLSPSDRAKDVADKVRDWLDAGASRVWEVRPKTRTVVIHRADRSTVTRGLDDILTSADAGFAVEGFALSVAEIFED